MPDETIDDIWRDKSIWYSECFTCGEGVPISDLEWDRTVLVVTTDIHYGAMICSECRKRRSGDA